MITRQLERECDANVSPLGGRYKVLMGIIVRYNISPTDCCSHSPRVHQDPCLVVMDTIPVTCKSILFARLSLQLAAVKKAGFFFYKMNHLKQFTHIRTDLPVPSQAGHSAIL